MSKQKTNAIIAEIEKAKNECLTVSQKNIDDGYLQNAKDDLCAAKLFIDSAIKQIEALQK